MRAIYEHDRRGCNIAPQLRVEIHRGEVHLRLMIAGIPMIILTERDLDDFKAALAAARVLPADDPESILFAKDLGENGGA